MANDVQIAFVGTLGGDPEVKYGQDGSPRCRLRIAANPSKYDREQRTYSELGVTQWYSATAFGEDAELWADNLRKGQRVRIEGLLVFREWQAQDGTMRLEYEIRNPRITVPLPKAGNSAHASQDGFSAPNTSNPGTYAGAAYNAPQGRTGDVAGNLAQMDPWAGRGNSEVPF
jgi:single-strand DNA-binding protein